MKAVVLAAGEGTRMRPLSVTRPKPMLPVVDRPLLAHVLDAAIDAGVTELILVVGYEGDVIRERFGTEYRGVPVRYAVQRTRDGTADAVVAAAEHLDGPFLVLNGDNLYEAASIETLIERTPAIAAFEVDQPSNYGVLSIDAGVVTDVVEKPDAPPTNVVNAGAYSFPADALDWLGVSESDRGEREITDVVATTIERETVTPVALSRWLDIGRPWELLEANELLLSDVKRRIAGDVSEGATVTGPVVVEEGATIRPGVVIEGPVMIRSGATVGPNAYVRGPSVVGPDATVGHAVEVKASLLCAGATVGHLSYVGDSILGRDVNFGAGTTTANLRHDDQPIAFTVKGERVSTGRRKFGVVAGDGVKTGIDTSLSPGVRLGRGATTRPGEVVDRDRTD